MNTAAMTPVLLPKEAQPEQSKFTTTTEYSGSVTAPTATATTGYAALQNTPMLFKDVSVKHVLMVHGPRQI
jgi:hypothetical protein